MRFVAHCTLCDPAFAPQVRFDLKVGESWIVPHCPSCHGREWEVFCSEPSPCPDLDECPGVDWVSRAEEAGAKWQALREWLEGCRCAAIEHKEREAEKWMNIGRGLMAIAALERMNELDGNDGEESR